MATEDGLVLTAGDTGIGLAEAADWQGIIDVSAGSRHILGVDGQGRVQAAGDNGRGQCDVSSWRDVVAVAAGAEHSLGLRADGTVLATGNNDDDQCAVDVWRLGSYADGLPEASPAEPCR